jgi:hypothetical protein
MCFGYLFPLLYLRHFFSRKAAKSAHPDKGGTEAQMASINEAYEVLSNEGKDCVPFFPVFYKDVALRTPYAL